MNNDKEIFAYLDELKAADKKLGMLAALVGIQQKFGLPDAEAIRVFTRWTNRK